MRRLLTFTLLALALALPAAAAARRHSPTDGKLSVRNARGIITLQGPARDIEAEVSFRLELTGANAGI